MGLWKSVKDTVGKPSKEAEQTKKDTPQPVPETKAGAGEETPEWYVVKKGETLSHLAQRFYGKASLYRKIYNANTDVLKDPNKIRAGQKLRIPK